MITLERARATPEPAGVRELELAAARARRHVLRMLQAHPAGHVGGALSAMDLVIAIYGHALRWDPADVGAADRDRFLLSAGHKALAQYAALAEVGIIGEDVLDTYGQTDSRLPGHPDLSVLPGIEANTGALGHGLPIGCGMALGARLDAQRCRIFVLLGDGELAEGSNWEAAAAAAHHSLDNLIALVDVNGLQISGPTAQVLNMESIAGKFDAFGWATAEIDGHDLAAICHALDRVPLQPGRPTAIIARTVKGKGIAAIEGAVGSHYWKPDADALAAAISEADEAVRRAERVVSTS